MGWVVAVIHHTRTMAKSLIGARFGRLVVVAQGPSDRGRRWICKCDCGGQSLVKTGHLNAGVQSCGCLVAEVAQQLGWAALGKRKRDWVPESLRQKLKNTYRNMLGRCYETENPRWPHYGGRGILVCAEWLGHSGRDSFYRWAVNNGCNQALQIDRINVDGNYEPDNCRWVTPRVQANNTTRNRYIAWSGETLTVSQWADRFGLSYCAMQHRVDRGWPMERIASQRQRGRQHA